MASDTDFKSPFALYMSGMEQAFAMGRAAQNMAAQAFSEAADWRSEASTTGKEDPFLADPEQMRTAFHKLANMNLQRWEKTAELLQAMPFWARVPNQLTGRLLTDWFDKARRQNPFFQFEDEGEAEPAGEELEKAERKADKVAAAKPPKAAKAKKTKKSSPKPKLLKAAKGAPDDLTEIKGVGPVLSAQLNELGVFHFQQIADWSKANADWVDNKLKTKGRVRRDGWVKQARRLAT